MTAPSPTFPLLWQEGLNSREIMAGLPERLDSDCLEAFQIMLAEDDPIPVSEFVQLFTALDWNLPVLTGMIGALLHGDHPHDRTINEIILLAIEHIRREHFRQ